MFSVQATFRMTTGIDCSACLFFLRETVVYESTSRGAGSTTSRGVGSGVEHGCVYVFKLLHTT